MLPTAGGTQRPTSTSVAATIRATGA